MKTIVYFHIGRGGQFYNSGHRTFNGTMNIGDVLVKADNSGQHSFFRDRDENGRFCKPFYTDSNGNYLISEADVKSGVGQLNWDNEYDTDICTLLSECGESDLRLIHESGEWNKEAVIQEYFDNFTSIKVDWQRFSGDYLGLIDDYFLFNSADVEAFYKGD